MSPCHFAVLQSPEDSDYSSDRLWFAVELYIELAPFFNGLRELALSFALKYPSLSKEVA